MGRVGRSKRQWYQLGPPDFMALPHPRVGTGKGCQQRGRGEGSLCPGPAGDWPGPGRAGCWLPQQAWQQRQRPLHPMLSVPGLKLISASDASVRPSTHSRQDTRHTQAPGGHLQPEPLLRAAGDVWRAGERPETPEGSLQWGEDGVPGWSQFLSRTAVPSDAWVPMHQGPSPAPPPMAPSAGSIHFGACPLHFLPNESVGYQGTEAGSHTSLCHHRASSTEFASQEEGRESWRE